MKPPDLFITGATGLVGNAILRCLDPTRFSAIRLLYRDSQSLPDSLALCENVEWVQGSLEDPSSYAHSITDDSVILHLAARTGGAPRQVHDRINRQATKDLLEAARAAGARGFLFVSTIAVSFRSCDGYAYAEAKARAEEEVKASGLRWTIVRPTMVFGPEAPVWLALESLARKAVVPVPGGGRVRIQPIWVDDLAGTLLRILQADRFLGEILELGGVDIVTMDELLGRMQKVIRRSAQPRLLHIPLKPLLPILRLLEGILPFHPPVTAGQFCSFLREGTAAPFSPNDGIHRPSWTVDRMIRALVGSEEPPDANPKSRQA